MTNPRTDSYTMKLFSTLLFALLIILLIYLFEQSYFTLPGFIQAGVFLALLYFFTEHIYESMKTEEPMTTNKALGIEETGRAKDPMESEDPLGLEDALKTDKVQY